MVTSACILFTKQGNNVLVVSLSQRKNDNTNCTGDLVVVITPESQTVCPTPVITEYHFLYTSIQAKMIIHAAYGSQRHLGVYMELGLQPDQIYIINKKHRSASKKLCQVYTNW